MEGGLALQVKQLFGEKTLYEVLSCDKRATPAELKKAYLRASLQFHPDKGGDTARFVCLGAVHQLLADEDRRGVYDETGEVLDVHEETLPEGDFPWTTYWRNLFPEVTPSAIDDFARKFRGSDEERDAVLAAYERKEGDMDLVVDEIMLAEPVDVGRFVQHYVLPAIASKKIRKYSALKRFEKAPVVERAANVKSKEEKNSDADLMKMIQSRKSGMDELVTKLASKYGDAKKKKGGKREPSPPDDEEFERIQKEMLERSRGANGKKGRK